MEQIPQVRLGISPDVPACKFSHFQQGPSDLACEPVSMGLSADLRRSRIAHQLPSDVEARLPSVCGGSAGRSLDSNADVWTRARCEQDLGTVASPGSSQMQSATDPVSTALLDTLDTTVAPLVS